MTTYNPYAFQKYEVKAAKVQTSFAAKRLENSFARAEQDLHKFDRFNASNSAYNVLETSQQMKKPMNGQASGRQFYKWMFCLMVIALFVTSFYLVRASAVSSSSELAGVEEKTIIVGAGDTLWKLASVHYEHISDKGYAVFLIKERNGLKSDVIKPGEQLILPSY